MIDLDTLLAGAERLCRAIAPLDLGDKPLYIVPQSRLPPGLGGRSVLDGFTHRSLDLYLRDVIGPAWRGRGACMVVREVEPTETMDAFDVEVAFRAIVVHELAHIVARGELWQDRDENDHGRIAAEAAAMDARVAGPPPPEVALFPFYGHGGPFVRTVLHLCHRVAAAGECVAPSEVFLSPGYCLSPLNAYRAALGSEPRRLAKRSFRDILKMPCPKKFWCLWTADVAQWLSLCPPEIERCFA